MENKDLKYNLLIVDDEVEITKSLYRQFRRKYNVFTANSASEAFPILESENIQVVLSDQRMPGITGVDFFKSIKEKYPDALKLIISGYADLEAVIGAINEGQVFRYITKPWEPVELELSLKEAFEKYELITKNKKLMKKLEDINLGLEEEVQRRTAELEKANEKLIQLNQEKNKYVGMVAHDLRNPIGAAQAFSTILIDEFDEHSKVDKIKYLGVIEERCRYAINLIREFLDISKIEAGTFDLNLKEYDYVEVVKKVVLQHTNQAKNKEQIIRFNANNDTVKLTFDKDKLEQVVSNLLSNAIKYSMPGKEIKVNVSVNEQSVLTEVVDNGQGIPEDEIATLFQPYQATTTKATAGEKSVGLGLTIVKKIIDAHKGEIYVHSELGAGTTFAFQLCCL